MAQVIYDGANVTIPGTISQGSANQLTTDASGNLATSGTISATGAVATGALTVTGAISATTTVTSTGNLVVGANKVVVTAASGNIVSKGTLGAGTNGTEFTVSAAGAVAAALGFLAAGPTSGIGYATGAGDAPTAQGTNKSTGITSNHVCGSLTMNAASLAATTSVGFTFTNSAIAATDVVLVSIKSGATADSYTVTVDAVAAGSCRISLRNVTAGALAEAVVLNFVVIKSVAA